MDEQRTILVIEDERDYLENMAMVLSHNGYRVLQAENGEQGIAMAKDHLPHLILCDLMMPGMSGFEVIKALKKEPKTSEIPLMFLTAYDHADNEVQGLELGARDYVSKTADNRELLARIKTHIALYEHTKNGLSR